MPGKRLTDEELALAASGGHGPAALEAMREQRDAMHDALMKAQWAFRHACNGCDCQRVAAEAVDAVLEAHEVGNG